MKNTIIAQQLAVIKNKGNCHYTVDRAHSVLKAIKNYVNPEEYTKIHIALNHKSLGEGSAELNDVIDPIIKKYHSI